MDELTLLDWKRRIFELYAGIRADPEPQRAWERWCDVRAELFRSHPQSPSHEAQPRYFDYDPALRVFGAVEPAERVRREIATSGEEPYAFTRFGRTRFELAGGVETYGACRYLLDTVKGADLGERDGRLVLDFNFSYNPSCAYDPRWVCPLAPPGNRLAVPVGGGERTI